MKKISIILLILCLSGCASVKPHSTILIYPADEKGVKKVEIMQQRLGKTTYKDEDIEASYDSKGVGLITGITKEIMPVLMLKALDD